MYEWNLGQRMREKRETGSLLSHLSASSGTRWLRRSQKSLWEQAHRVCFHVSLIACCSGILHISTAIG